MATTMLCLDGEWSMYYGRHAEMDGLTVGRDTWLRKSGLRSVTARVPGNFEMDFQKAGILEDPFYGGQVQHLQAYEYYDFIYTRTFPWNRPPTGREQLVFEGIDTYADIYLNGILVGSTDNMLIEHTIQTPSLLNGENELVVHIKSTVLEARKYGYHAKNTAIDYNYDSLFVRKSPHMYGWDIMPRMLSRGIWRSARIQDVSAVRIEQAYLYTENITDAGADTVLFYELELADGPAYEYEVIMTAVCGDHQFGSAGKVWGKCGKKRIPVCRPKLWFPIGYGDQSLYEVTVQLIRSGHTVDAKTFQTGIRMAALLRTSVVDDAGQGEFCFVVNGKRIFVMGANWTPPDALPSRADDRAAQVLELAEDIGCNAVRIWGGGRYEKDEFYTLCDRKGILVWHDFIMSCGTYPHSRDFIDRLSLEVRQVVRRLRHHPSICLWAGDNECDVNYLYQVNADNPNSNVLTRGVIPQALMEEDFTRPYLPSSPYIDEECYRKGLDSATENHLWGDRLYFKAPCYKEARALFASEMGYHGCPSPDSVRRFISPECLWPPEDNREWLLHATSPEPSAAEPFGYRVILMKKQIVNFFGCAPGSLADYCLASQISQAEAMQYFIERFRIRKGERTGIIWWNICDGWPQMSDAAVDYYFRKKLAYHYIRRSQQPVCLMVDEPVNGRYRIVGVNDSGYDVSLRYTVTAMKNMEETAAGEIRMPAHSNAISVGSFYAHDQKDMVLLTWEGYDQRRAPVSGKNSRLLGEPAFGLSEYVGWAEKAGLLELEGFEEPDALENRSHIIASA